jgi:Protein of unknown function (DUF3551)
VFDENTIGRLDAPQAAMRRQGDEMRRMILALLAASGLAAIGVLPAAAVGTRYPFCIQGDEQPGLSNCTFVSYEQCQATAAGRRLYCIANPFYAGDGDDRRAYRRPPPPSRGFFGLFDD